MTLGFLPSGLTKEIRALFPTWLACAVAVAAAALTKNHTILQAALLAYGLGSLALGAQSMGHEYTHRTLGLLLSQPRDRRRLFLTKSVVLTSMLVTLNAIAWAVMVKRTDLQHIGFWHGSSLFLVAICALFLAPWLTMLCRSPLAGVVFTGAIPGLLWTSMNLLALAKSGFAGISGMESLILAVWWRTMFAICAIAAISSWRMFMRLEAIEGRDPEIHMPRWLGRQAGLPDGGGVSRPRTQHPVWLLVKKELHLQQITFAVVGLYVLCWTTASLMDRFVPDFPVDFPLFPITILYFGLLSILIGSLASAEERQFGTLEWQVLLPMPMWRQWMLKVVVVIGLALLLGVALPIALGYVHVTEDMRVQGAPVWHDKAFVVHMTAAIVLLAACGLYLSSLSTTGVHALVLSIPVAFAGAAFLPYAAAWSARLAWVLMKPGAIPRGFHRSPPALLRFASSDHLILAGAAGLVILLLRFALHNHRSAERSVRRISWQGMWIAGYLTLAVLLLAGVETFMRTRFY